MRRLGSIFDIRFELYQRKYFVKSLNNFIAQLTPFIFYAAGGYYYPGKDDAQLKAEMQGYLDRGYTVVKMKIGGASLAEDLRRI